MKVSFMGYQVQAIFLDGDDALAAEVHAAWPEAYSKRVKEAFNGWAIAVPTSIEGDARDEASDVQALADDTLAEDPRVRVRRWSRRVPGQTVVYIDADCFGGACLYTGYICRDGELVREEPRTRRGEGALRRLMAALGVDLSPDEYLPR